MNGIKAQRKESEKKMSFVALICKTEEGIVAVADSKASREYQEGKLQEDVKRGHIDKIFRNDTFIFVTSGINEIKENSWKIRIEDWVRYNLRDGDTPEDFFERFGEVVKNNPVIPNAEYHFCYGAKDNHGYYIREVIVKTGENNVIFKGKDHADVIYTAGETWYYTAFNTLIDVNYNLSLQELKELTKKQIETLINLYEMTYPDNYNSVGGDIRSLIFI